MKITFDSKLKRIHVIAEYETDGTIIQMAATHYENDKPTKLKNVTRLVTLTISNETILYPWQSYYSMATSGFYYGSVRETDSEGMPYPLDIWVPLRFQSDITAASIFRRMTPMTEREKESVCKQYDRKLDWFNSNFKNLAEQQVFRYE